MNLYNYFLTQDGRRIIKLAHYFVVYERYLSQYVNKPVLFFEIGTGDGGSAQLWKRYFGPMARIVTIDIRELREYEESQIFVRTGSQSDPEFLKRLVEEFGRPDVVLDDASHNQNDVNATFEVLFPLTKDTGLYMVEDLMYAYWEKTAGGYKSPTSFIEKCKDLVDELNAPLSLASPETMFSKTALSVAFYGAMVVIEKSPYINRETLYLPGGL